MQLKVITVTSSEQSPPRAQSFNFCLHHNVSISNKSFSPNANHQIRDPLPDSNLMIL